MGVIKRGILGGFSGSVAGVVGSSWKGIAVIKAKPLSVANPQSPAQTTQRNKFKSCQSAASFLLTKIIKPLWDRTAQLMSGYNDFIKRNIAAFDGDGIATVADIIMSPGKLEETDISVLSIVADQKNVSIDWVDDSGQGEKLATDVAYMVAYNRDNEEFAQSDGSAVRSDENCLVTFVSDMTAGDVISVWLAFADADKRLKFKAGSDLSNSVQ